MSKLQGVKQIELIAQKNQNLDTVCYRGDAPLVHLAMISQADVFDQVSNPDGLQRDLSPKHASDAYEYVSKPKDPARPRAYPEIVLNVRKKSIIQIEEAESGNIRLLFDIDRIQKEKGVSVSRIDGNHRLYFAEGDKNRSPILSSVPFQIHVGLTRDQERSLFVDINANQKGLNSSHLAIMESKLTPEEVEIRDHLERWITNKLTNDPNSPWHGLIHLGGSKKGSSAQGLTRVANETSLQSGINKLIKKSQYIHDFTDPSAQYVLVRNYWLAVKKEFSLEWADSKNFLLHKNIGLLSFSILGGTILDRCIPRKTIGVDDMLFYLKQVHQKFDWGVKGPIAGMSGNQAALKLAGAMASELTDNSDAKDMRQLQEQLLMENH